MKNHRKLNSMLALIGLIAMMPFVAFPQHEGREYPSGEKREKLKSHKIAFITERLELTPAEAEKFWPVYNEHEAAMEAFHKEFKKGHPFEPEAIDDMSEADANVFIEEHMKHEQQAFEQRKAFIAKLKGVIPAKKILMLMEAEKDFRVEVVRKVTGKDGPPAPNDENLMQKPEKK